MKRGTSIFFKAVRVAIAVGLLIYLGMSGIIKWNALLGLATAWWLTLAALLLWFMAMVVIAVRLCVLLKPNTLHLSLLASVRLTLIGAFFNTCLPGATGGDLVKIYYATKQNRGRRMEITTVILLDRAVGMFSLTVLPILLTLFFPELVRSQPVLRGILWGAGAIATAMLAGILITSVDRVKKSRLMSWAFQKLPLGNYAARVFDTIHAYRYNRVALLISVGLSLITHLLTISVMLCVVKAINPAGIEWQMALLIPLGLLASSLPVTPGGLGVGEAAFDKLFTMAGLTGGAETLLGWRIITILIGMIGLFFYSRGREELKFTEN